MRHAALLYIGQTPRPDVTGELACALPEDVALRDYGMLDGLTPREIAALAPQPDEARLVTRLSDGRPAAVAEARLFPLAARRLREAEWEDPAFCVLMCTGAFPPLPHSGPFQTAHDLLHGDPTLSSRREALGVILPDPDQLQQAQRWWGGGLLPERMAFASPYEGDSALVGAANALRQAGASVLVLDCMGYTLEQSLQIEAATGLPVALPRQKVIDEILRLCSTKE